MSATFEAALTPCPSKSRSLGIGENSDSETWDSLVHATDPFEATGQIEFTTEIRAPTLTGARPRRANRNDSVFEIHEDAMKKQTGPSDKRRRPNMVPKPSDRKSSLLAQPAQRFRPKVNFAPSPPSRPVTRETETRLSSTRPAKKAVEETQSVSRPSPKPSVHSDNDSGLKKGLRRNTVYIPPDDTTVASVFMDLFSPLKKSQGGTMPQLVEDAQVNTLEARIAERQMRKARAGSARKAPLQPSAKIAQEAATRFDVAGKNGGKENIPPGALYGIGKNSKSSGPLKPSRSSIQSTSMSSRHLAAHEPNKSAVSNPGQEKVDAAKKRNVLAVRKNNTTSSRTRINHEETVLKSHAPVTFPDTLDARTSTLSERRGHSEANNSSRHGHKSSKLSVLKELNHQYPMLNDDLSKPLLYEDDWLSHQESVITQLVNALFECTNGDKTTFDQDILRLDLLELYHTEYFTRLYKRLQSSLSCGNLSIPKEVLERNGRFIHDVGLRRKFLDIWIKSYDLRALTAALETVVGRKVSSDTNLFESSLETSPPIDAKRQKMLVRKLEGFLEAFLVRNDDLEQAAHKRDTLLETRARCYRRTVLRSILLVVLLDQGRQSPHGSLPRRLFVPSSPFKSSAELLQALVRILLPSCGHITKQLSHLDCHLSYKQHQLQEYDYQMSNLAVDLRDGVRLTKIVEVLFFTSGHPGSDLEDQTELTLNTGEVLSLHGDSEDLPLSKQLKYPCVSRAAKVFNVQIALSALQAVKGSGVVLDDLRAEDIVDGYQEKTIALLWGLVSKWGLAGLVDWQDVTKEIVRLRRKALTQLSAGQIRDDFCEKSDHHVGDDDHAQLLQEWATLLAALKGLHVNNLTTNFANGKIYEAIVDEYEPYIVGNTDQSDKAASKRATLNSLDSRLRLLGCSPQFAHLVSPGSTPAHILDRDSTLGALAFLCSRLLTTSKRARAAVILQRAWRARLATRDTFRRTVAKNLAEHCAAVVQTRNEILWAKEVITRWWRKQKAQQQREKIARSERMRRSSQLSRRPARRRL